jgi:hypothetical protein
MAPMMRRVADLDDQDLDDFDPAYFPKRVYKDGRGPRVALMLTDAAPPRSRAALYDASHHRPHYAEVSDVAAEGRAVAAYEAHNKWLQDAWRGPANQPPEPEPGESERDAYIRRLGNAWKPLPDLPARDPDDDDDPRAAATAVEAQRRRWNAESPTKDAALADRDVVYDEYIHRLTTAWKRP